MIRKLESTVINKDERGSIIGILNSINIKEINLTKSNPCSTRGGHYHKHTTEFIYILSGTGELSWKEIKTSRNGNVRYKAGDIFEVVPLDFHTMKAKTRTTFMKFLTRDQTKEEDIHKI
jgi:dTDP-4-dehydrorhamnose 3,5-epimerase-like enzyme